jgi:hypothetical protein
MYAYKETDVRESPNDSTLTGREGQGSRGETYHPHYHESPVSSVVEHLYLVIEINTCSPKDFSVLYSIILYLVILSAFIFVMVSITSHSLLKFRTGTVTFSKCTT